MLGNYQIIISVTLYSPGLGPACIFADFVGKLFSSIVSVSPLLGHRKLSQYKFPYFFYSASLGDNPRCEGSLLGIKEHSQHSLSISAPFAEIPRCGGAHGSLLD